MSSYCASVRDLPLDNIHRQHHDSEHGTPAKSDDDLFRRLILEISQAGLSFETVLKKKKAIYSAFPSVAVVAQFTEQDIERLLQNPGIIRHRGKIEAAIFNAKTILELQKTHGSFASWLQSYYPQTKDGWTVLFKKTFKFTGGEIVNEFLSTSCYLPRGHSPGCRLYNPKYHAV